MKITYLKIPAILEDENTNCANFNGHCCAAGQCCNKPGSETTVASLVGEENQLLSDPQPTSGIEKLISSLDEDKIKLLKESGITDSSINNLVIVD